MGARYAAELKTQEQPRGEGEIYEELSKKKNNEKSDWSREKIRKNTKRDTLIIDKW